MPVKKGFPSWGVFIRHYLLHEADNQEDYVLSIYNHYNSDLKKASYRPISFMTFVNYIWVLKTLGGLERTRNEPAHISEKDARPATYLYTVDQPPLMHKGGTRHYYAVVAGTETSAFWEAPRLALSEIQGKPRG